MFVVPCRIRDVCFSALPSPTRAQAAGLCSQGGRRQPRSPASDLLTPPQLLVSTTTQQVIHRLTTVSACRSKSPRRDSMVQQDLPSRTPAHVSTESPTVNAPSANRLCSRCAAIDFESFFSTEQTNIEFGVLSDWDPDRCDICTFLSQCYQQKGPRYQMLSSPVTLWNTSFAHIREYMSNFAGVIMEALPTLGLEDGYSYCVLYDKGGTTDWMHLARTPDVNVLPRSLSALLNWSDIRQWTQKSAEGDSVSLRPGPTPGNTVPEAIYQLYVIDCDNRSLVRASTDTQYVTLSYVWGFDSTSFDDMSVVDVISRTLPRTLEDAMIVCRRLDYRYLWIDRYCIPQNDPVQRHRQIGHMDAIYARSSLTIIACAGQDPHYGLPGVTRPRQIPSVHIEGLGFLQLLPLQEDITCSVCAERGWTYQETLLSQKRLYFTDRQLYFEDDRTMTCEWTALSQAENITTPDSNLLHSQRTWLSTPSDIYGCISRYTGRKLTFDSDALNAFLGIPSVYEQHFRMHHLWGMPYLTSDNDTYALPRMTHNFFFIRNPGSVRRADFPSWSWAGWTRTVM